MADIQQQITDIISYASEQLNVAERINISFDVLAITALCLRFYVRLFMTRQFGWDDATMAGAVVLYLLHSACALAAIHYGKVQAAEEADGHFTIALDPHIALLTHITIGAYSLWFILVKLSVSFFFLQILDHRKIERRIIKAIVAACILSGLGYFSIAFTCVSYKEYPLVTGNCKAELPGNVLFALCSVINILSDIVFVSLAVFTLARTRLPFLTKLSAGFLLALGSAGAVATAVRMYIVLKPATNVIEYSNLTLDFTKWVLAETGTTMVATNLAVIRPLFNKVLEKLNLLQSIEASGRKTTMLSNKQRTGMSTPRLRGVKSEMHDSDERELFTIKKDMTVAVDEEKITGVDMVYTSRQDL